MCEGVDTSCEQPTSRRAWGFGGVSILSTHTRSSDEAQAVRPGETAPSADLGATLDRSDILARVTHWRDRIIAE